MATRFGPSAEALAFLADPANRETWRFSAAELPAKRVDRCAEAEAVAPTIAARHNVSLNWQEIDGVACLVITPDRWDGATQMLYLFGGAFIMGGPLEDLVISAALAQGTGMQVVSPAYALAPETPFPGGLNDALSVARAIRAAAVAGESAGGNFALSVTRALVAENAPPQRLAVLSPAADMSPAFDPFAAPDDPTLYPPFVAELTQEYAPGTDPFDDRVSPLYGSYGAGWPPCLITTGTRDLFLPQCAQLARAMRQGGAEVDLRVWDGMWHVFEYYDNVPEGMASLQEISAFLSGEQHA